MAVAHAVTLLAVVLGQAPTPAEPQPQPSRAAPAQPVRPQPKAEADAPAQAIRLSDPRLVARPTSPAALVAPGAPALRLDRPTRCFDRGDGRAWRAQCDANEKTCLVAPDAELDADGEPVAAVDRAGRCIVPGWREQDLVPQGYKLVPALAETPPGWHRDERQRIMQVNFDLNRRIWLGAGWAAGGLVGSDGGEVNAGIRIDFPFRVAGAPALGRFRALETFGSFDGHFVDFVLAGFDASRAYPSPLFRITTFVGKPRRFDPPLFVGAWLEAVRAESLKTGAGWYDRTGVGAGALTVDLWRSRDLSSFVRLRGGVGYEVADQLSGAAWVPFAAADADITLDRGGFHRVRGTLLGEWLATVDDYQPTEAGAPLLAEDRSRTTGKVEYELILLAINDQPISAVLDARAQKRNDVPGLDTGWLFQGTASLRFNLWAPPRRDAPAQERL